MRKQLVLVVAVLLLLALAAGCASKRSESPAYDSGASYAPEPAPAAPQYAPDASAAADYFPEEMGLEAEKLSSTAANNYGGRKIIRRFEYNITSSSFDADLETLQQSAIAAGGYVASSSVNGTKPETYNDSGRYAYLTFAIPAEKVDAFVAGVEQVGTVTYRNSNTQDVSDQYLDLETRIAVLRTQQERLKSLLVESASLEEILALETEIARVTIEIEQLTTNLKALASLVDYSTVDVSIQEERIAQGPSSTKTMGTRISEGFVSVLNGVGVFLENFAVFLIVSSPVWLILGVIALVVILLVRRHNRKKRAKAQAAAGNNSTAGSGRQS